MKDIVLIQHNRGAFLLRLLGLGPRLARVQAIDQLQKLLENNTFWAKGRTKKKLKKMIAHSSVIVTLWKENKLIGFGRGTTDMCFRAVLWDIVIDKNHQKHGLGSLLLESLMNSKSIKNVEKIYLMTTNCKEFYKNKGFIEPINQTILINEF